MINENTSFKTDFKTIGLVVAMVVSVSSTYFSLKGQIDENKKALEKGEWVNEKEYNLKDQAVREAIYSTQEDVKEIKEQLSRIDERLYNLNK